MDVKIKVEPIDDLQLDQDALDFLPTPTVTSITSVPKHQNQPLEWHHKVNLMGASVPSPRIHLCDSCQQPILVYGRLIPCKHVLCFDCAEEIGTLCLKCREPVLRVEKTGLGSIFRCRRETCHRTYLSQRDLLAHIKHRHVKRSQRTAAGAPGSSSSMMMIRKQ